MRKIVLTIHLSLSMILGMFIVVTCTSGSFLLIEGDVNNWLHPVNHKLMPGDISASVIKQNADAIYPEYKTDRIDFPTTKDGLYHVHLSKDGGGKDGFSVYADPGSGEVFGKVQEERLEPFATMYQLHRYFLLMPLLGISTAASIVGLLGIGLLLILLTGVYLWWPGIHKWALGFRIVHNRGRLVHNMSLHKTIGIVSIPFLLLAALTGTVNAFEKSIPVWIGFKAKEEIPAAAIQSLQPNIKGAASLPLDRVIEIVKETNTTNKIIRIQFPLKPGQSFQVGLKAGFGASKGSNSTVYIDASTGTILYKTAPNLAINLYNAWRKGLHFATWGGETIKLITFVFGMMPLVLMITGISIWGMKASIRKRNSKARTATNTNTAA